MAQNKQKQVTLKQTSQFPAKPFRVIKKVSSKQAKLNAAYKIVRDAFMERKTVCQAQWEGCTHIATQCHHAGGRIGENMLDDTKFRALCHNCHYKVELSPERAKAEGLSEDRLSPFKQIIK